MIASIDIRNVFYALQIIIKVCSKLVIHLHSRDLYIPYQPRWLLTFIILFCYNCESIDSCYSGDIRPGWWGRRLVCYLRCDDDDVPIVEITIAGNPDWIAICIVDCIEYELNLPLGSRSIFYIAWGCQRTAAQQVVNQLSRMLLVWYFALDIIVGCENTDLVR